MIGCTYTTILNLPFDPSEFPNLTRTVIVFRMAQREHIRAVLMEHGAPMSPQEIKKALLQKGLSIPGHSIRSRLYSHEKGDRPTNVTKVQPLIFVRVAYGKWTVDMDAPLHAGAERTTDTPRMTLPPLNLVLEGVPGVGKTHRVAKIVESIGSSVRGDGTGRFAITMHPATTYEEFVEGLRPTLVGETREARNQGWCATKHGRTPRVTVRNRSSGKVENLTEGLPWFWNANGTPYNDAKFVLEDGFFLRVCAEAVHFPNKHFVVLLDEFNRCNIPKVLGDLLTSVESSKRARWTGDVWDVSDCPRPTLPGSKRLFFVPDNVIVVATMNTSDRSVGGLDAAMRRRFAFERVWPHGFDPKLSCGPAGVLDAVLEMGTEAASTLTGEPRDLLQKTVEVWHALNVQLVQIGPDALLGHSYLYDLRKALENATSPPDACDRRYSFGNAQQAVAHVWLQQMLPQLCDILDANHRQRLDDLAPLNSAIAGLNLEVQLQPPSDGTVHRTIQINVAPKDSP